MQLDYAMLALNADIAESGLLHIFGGGFDTFTVTAIPADVQFQIVLRFQAEGADAMQPHRFGLSISNPQGELKSIREDQLLPFPPANEKQISSAIVAIKLFLRVKYIGEYNLNILSEGQIVKSLPLRIEMSNNEKAIEVQ